MSSINFNESATVALKTLRNINKNLNMVQQEISTGKSVSNAKDNAAVWAISTVMQTDIDSFETVSDSLGLGNATVGVARAASEQVTGLLQEMKGLIVSAQEENVDRSKIQTDVGSLRDQITSIVNAAQFNGLNLLKGGGTVDVLSSLDRSSSGAVTVANISTSKNDLQVQQQALGTGTATIAGAVSGATIADAAAGTVTYTAGALTEGESFAVTVGTDTFEYVARDGDTLNEVNSNLASLINNAGITGVTASAGSVADPETTNSVLTVNNASGGVLAFTEATTSGGTAGGGLGALVGLDVSTDVGAESALAAIEGLLQTSIDASASFGSSQKRIEIQDEFVTNLVDSMKAGISSLTDADLEASSARLQSLQVQQQLGTQALSIANQAPQSILSLFR